MVTEGASKSSSILADGCRVSRDEPSSDDLEGHSVGSAPISTSAITLPALDGGAVVGLGKRGLDDVGRATDVDIGTCLEAVLALADDLEGHSVGAALISTSSIPWLACDAGAVIGLGKRGSDDVGRATDVDIGTLSDISVVQPAPTAELSATWFAESRRVAVSGAGEDDAGALESARATFTNPTTRCAVRMGVRLRGRAPAPMRIRGDFSGMKCFPHAARTVMHQ